jgi:hypothetical protein
MSNDTRANLDSVLEIGTDKRNFRSNNRGGKRKRGGPGAKPTSLVAAGAPATLINPTPTTVQANITPTPITATVTSASVTPIVPQPQASQPPPQIVQ